MKINSITHRKLHKFAPIKDGVVHFKHGESVLIGCSYLANELEVEVVPNTWERIPFPIPLSRIIVTCNNGKKEYSGKPFDTEIEAPGAMFCKYKNDPIIEWRNISSTQSIYEEYFRVFDNKSKKNYTVDVMDGMWDTNFNALYSHLLMVSIMYTTTLVFMAKEINFAEVDKQKTHTQNYFQVVLDQFICKF